MKNKIVKKAGTREPAGSYELLKTRESVLQQPSSLSSSPSRCPRVPGRLLPHGPRVGPAPPLFTVATLVPLVPPSSLAPSLPARADPKLSEAPQLLAALRGGRTPRGAFGKLPAKAGASISGLGAIKLFTCPKGISRGRLGSWLLALTLPLAWPGSKGFTAFFWLIVGVSVESGNVCRLSKVSLSLSPPVSPPAPPHTAPHAHAHAGPGAPANRHPRPPRTFSRVRTFLSPHTSSLTRPPSPCTHL